MQPNRTGWISAFIATALAVLWILALAHMDQHNLARLDGYRYALQITDQQSAFQAGQWQQREIAPFESLTLNIWSLTPTTLVHQDLQQQTQNIPPSSWQTPLQQLQLNALARPQTLRYLTDPQSRVFVSSLPLSVSLLLFGILLGLQWALWHHVLWQQPKHYAVALWGSGLLLCPFLPYWSVVAGLFLAILWRPTLASTITATLVAATGALISTTLWGNWLAIGSLCALVIYQLLCHWPRQWQQAVAWLALLLYATLLPIRGSLPFWCDFLVIGLWQTSWLIHGIRLRRQHSPSTRPSAQALQQHFQQLQQDLQQLQDQNRLLREKTAIDPLTGLRNRLFFDQQYATELARSAREQAPISVILLDIDFFKRINDTYGHTAGDKVLQEVAKRLYFTLHRPGDALCRVGGEEFVVLLPQTDLKGAQHVAQQLIQNVNKSPIIIEEQPLKVTISAGVASGIHQHQQPIDTLYALADAGLYQAKGNGRNQVGFVPEKAADPDNTMQVAS